MAASKILEKISFDLPEINGAITAGIAQGTEESLRSEEVLHVVCIKLITTTDDGDRVSFFNKEECSKLTLALLYDRCLAAKIPNDMAAYLLQGAFVALNLGLIASYDETPDGDWKAVGANGLDEKMVTPERNDAIKAMLENVSPTSAATMIAATKVNWWKENHHTGQGAGSGKYVTKAFSKVVGTVFSPQWKSVIHRLGHWCSTRKVLDVLGIADILEVSPLYDVGKGLKASEDVKLRIQSSPAGTGRLSILFAISKQMLQSPAFFMCPGKEDYLPIRGEYIVMMNSPAAHHVGGKYLTGRKANYSDTIYEPKLGRAVTWLHAFIPKSTIKESPHAKNAEKYSDYSAEFKTACDNYKQTSADRFKKIMELLKINDRPNADDYISTLQAWGMKPSQSILDAVKEAQDKYDKEQADKKAAEAK